jgi:hypothetical protein
MGGRRHFEGVHMDKPPLSGAEAFARLLVAVYYKIPAALTSQECGDPTSSPRSDR